MKKMLILLFLMFITGCNIDYNATIYHNKRIREECKFTEENDFILKYNEDISLSLNSKIDSYKQYFDSYKFMKKINKDNSYVLMKKTNQNLDEFKTTTILNQLYEHIIIEENNNQFSFKFLNLVDDVSNNPDPNFHMDDIRIKIRLHNKVIESNADNVDEKKNTLEWIITQTDKEKNMFFKLDHKKRYDIILIDMFLFNKDTIIPICITLIIILSVLFYFYLRYKKNTSI